MLLHPSAKPMTAMTLITTISCSLCRRVRSTRGSSKLSKWAHIAGGCTFRHGTHFAPNGKQNQMRSPWARREAGGGGSR
jgi:hypothetical protein